MRNARIVLGFPISILQFRIFKFLIKWKGGTSMVFQHQDNKNHDMDPNLEFKNFPPPEIFSYVESEIIASTVKITWSTLPEITNQIITVASELSSSVVRV